MWQITTLKGEHIRNRTKILKWSIDLWIKSETHIDKVQQFKKSIKPQTAHFVQLIIKYILVVFVLNNILE